MFVPWGRFEVVSTVKKLSFGQDGKFLLVGGVGSCRKKHWKK